LDKLREVDIALLILPWPLFLIPFRFAFDEVILSMAIVSTTIGVSALALNRSILKLLTLNPLNVLYGFGYAVLLYAAFLSGHVVVKILGVGWQVDLIYSSVRVGYLELALLSVIGFMEEVYWRGYVQETLLRARLGMNWVLSSIPYALVHISSGLAVLVLAAWVAGLILGLSARLHGLSTSIITHILWLYTILYLMPTSRVLEFI